MLSLSRAGVQFLVREQRSHMLLNTARKEKKKNADVSKEHRS